MRTAHHTRAESETVNGQGCAICGDSRSLCHCAISDNGDTKPLRGDSRDMVQRRGTKERHRPGATSPTGNEMNEGAGSEQSRSGQRSRGLRAEPRAAKRSSTLTTAATMDAGSERCRGARCLQQGWTLAKRARRYGASGDLCGEAVSPYDTSCHDERAARASPVCGYLRRNSRRAELLGPCLCCYLTAMLNASEQ